MSKKKTKIWFKRVRGSYLPSSTEGWLTYIPFIGYCVGVALIVFWQTDTLWYQLFTVASQWVLATVLLTLVANHHSR